MKMEFRAATLFESDTTKCNILLDNQMQCTKKVVKIVKSDYVPPTLHNFKAHKTEYALCQGHFNVIKAEVQTFKDSIIVDLNEEETK